VGVVIGIDKGGSKESGSASCVEIDKDGLKKQERGRDPQEEIHKYEAAPYRGAGIQTIHAKGWPQQTQVILTSAPTTNLSPAISWTVSMNGKGTKRATSPGESSVTVSRMAVARSIASCLVCGLTVVCMLVGVGVPTRKSQKRRVRWNRFDEAY
jgi:hypothetical protein